MAKEKSHRTTRMNKVRNKTELKLQQHRTAPVSFHFECTAATGASIPECMRHLCNMLPAKHALT